MNIEEAYKLEEGGTYLIRVSPNWADDQAVKVLINSLSAYAIHGVLVICQKDEVEILPDGERIAEERRAGAREAVEGLAKSIESMIKTASKNGDHQTMQLLSTVLELEAFQEPVAV